MDPVTVSQRDGIFAAFVVAMAAFVAGLVWYVMKGKSGTDKTLLDFTMQTINKVGTSVEKVGDHMEALTASTQRLETKADDHGRKLDEHAQYLKDLKAGIGCKAKS